MASYPASIVSLTSPAGGTSLLATGPDHAALHGSVNAEIVAVETTLGTTSGTSVLKNLAGGFAVNDTAGTMNNGILGTPRITGGTASAFLLGTSTVTGGTINGQVVNAGTIGGGAYGTPTIVGGTIAVNGTTVALSFGAAIVPTAGSLTDTAGGTHIVNAQAAQIYYSAMGTAAGNRTIETPLNPTAWQFLNFGFKASGSANGTLVWGTAFLLSQDSGTPAIGTGTSWNWYAWRYNPIDTKWHFTGQTKNLA